MRTNIDIDDNLMGEAMKATKGTGNPQLLNKLLDDRLRG